MSEYHKDIWSVMQVLEHRVGKQKEQNVHIVVVDVIHNYGGTR